MKVILLQTVNGAISGDYTIVVLVGVVGFLFVCLGSLVAWSFIRALKQIEVELKMISERVEEQGENHNKLMTEHLLLSQEVKNQKVDPEALAATIAIKIRAIGEMRKL